MGNSRSKVKIHQHSDHEKVMQWSILISLWILTNPFALIPYAVPLGLSHEWVYLNKPFLVVLFAMVPLLIPIGLAMLHHFLAKAAQKEPASPLARRLASAFSATDRRVRILIAQIRAL